MDDFFSAVSQRPHTTRSGTCELPILYRDASQLGTLYLVDLGRARDLLAEVSAIEPWPVLRKAIGALYAWEYRDSTVGSYAEVGLGVLARRKGTRPSLARLVLDMGAQDDQGVWVASLPVTTQAAFEAGVDLWGYPKYVTRIETRFEHERARVTLGDEIEVEVGRLSGPLLRAQPVVTYTERAGRLIRTRIDVDHHVRWGLGSSVRLTLRGDGPLANAARRLGLGEARILAAFRTDGFRARLPIGVDLGPARDSGRPS
jgi:hypothetical protein